MTDEGKVVKGGINRNPPVTDRPSPPIGTGKKYVEKIPEKGSCPLPNGSTLFWEPNGIGGRTYASDEIGGGVSVWDTALIGQDTLLAAMTQEATILRNERYWEEQGKK